MLGWSIPLFRIRGIQLALHGSFLLLLAYVAWEGWTGQAWTGMIWSSLTLVAFFVCVVLHELGHSLTAMRFGIGVRRILLMPIGGMAEFDAIPRQPAREFWMTIAGPAVNFLIVGALWPAKDWFDQATTLYSLRGLVLQLFWANLVMGTFNLLPAFPMDGGRILRALLATRLPYLTATRRAVIVGKIVCALGVIVALGGESFGWWEGRLWLLAALFAFIFFAGETEYRALLRREREEAHWRETLARLQRAAVVEPPVLEPPILRDGTPPANLDEPPLLPR